MIVLSSFNGRIGITNAMEVLKSGNSALDAVEAGTRDVERNTKDQSVGLGGLPNLLGEVRLDAAIMDGKTLDAGAVGSVQGYVHAITLARYVMQETPHVFLVGDGAERLAREIGCEYENLLTSESEETWRQEIVRNYPHMEPTELESFGNLRGLVGALNQPMAGWPTVEPHGTVNFIAQDGDGNLATAVSTSGWPWSYPGRLGDSPVIGAGGYADNRWGAATSTGTGEVVLRTSATRSIVLYMKLGMSISDATCEALRDLRDLDDPLTNHIAIVAVDRCGHHVGYSHRPNERYVYMTEEMSEPTVADMVAP